MVEYVKWQVGAVSGMTSLAFILLVVLNLAQTSYSTDGDKACTDCFSQIEVNMTFWEICVEHAGDEEKALFAKRAASHTRWINLDAVDEIVTTDPEIHVDLMVRTKKRFSDTYSDEFGWLRNVKDGDCPFDRKTKSNPNPSYIYLHGQKGAFDTVKWNFNIEALEFEDIAIDPKWLPVKGKDNNTYECKTKIKKQEIVNMVMKNVTMTQPIMGNCTLNSTYEYCENTTAPCGEGKICVLIIVTNCTNITEPYNSTCIVGYENVTEEMLVENVTIKEMPVNYSCKLKKLKHKNLQIDFPSDVKAETDGKQLCIFPCDDGDCNLNNSQVNGWGWDQVCQPLNKLKEGTMSVSKYKKERVIQVEKVTG